MLVCNGSRIFFLHDVTDYDLISSGFVKNNIKLWIRQTYNSCLKGNTGMLRAFWTYGI